VLGGEAAVSESGLHGVGARGGARRTWGQCWRRQKQSLGRRCERTNGCSSCGEGRGWWLVQHGVGENAMISAQAEWGLVGGRGGGGGGGGGWGGAESGGGWCGAT
jgi:hypothetical protein